MKHFDVVVVGAGFGGLAAALTLGEAGAKVSLYETLKYPGGCASTFTKEGYRYEAGATLFSGLGPEQVFGRWIESYGEPTRLVEFNERIVDLVTPRWSLPIERTRGGLLRRLLEFPGAPAPELQSFFAEQRRVADTLWRLLDRPELLPPLSLSAALAHARRVLEYLPLLPRLGRPLGAILERSGLARFEPLRVYLDALCQITLQCSAAESEALFAFCAMDYYHRGAGHVRGGIGALAELLLAACARHGVEVQLATRVKGIEPVQAERGRFKVQTRRGDVYADNVIANVLPSQLASLLPPSTSWPVSLMHLSSRVEAGFGAGMLYGLLHEAPSVAGTPFQESSRPVRHRQVIADINRPFLEGNHLFVSLGEPQRGSTEIAGVRRSLTMSTHIPLPTLQARGDAGASYVAEVQARMRATFEQLCPDWASRLQHSFTASPRTFARFVGRSQGAVGGIPRRAGLTNYRQLGPYRVRPGLWLVGDSVFPGQSALAAAVGGTRAAAAVARSSGVAGSARVLGSQADATASLPPASV